MKKTTILQYSQGSLLFTYDGKKYGIAAGENILALNINDTSFYMYHCYVSKTYKRRLYRYRIVCNGGGAGFIEHCKNDIENGNTEAVINSLNMIIGKVREMFW